MAKIGDSASKANGMTAGTLIKSSSAGSDPYNVAGKAEGRDASSK